MFKYGKIVCWQCERTLHLGWPQWWHAITRLHRVSFEPVYREV